MENSIEEDINRCNKLTANWIGLSNQLALKRILSDYRRVLKENELLRQQNISHKNNIRELKKVRNK
nr:MAG TPA: Narbonolide/10-deoxymethynolide synthase PikA4 N-terminal domain [Caudoviricetes sp.]